MKNFRSFIASRLLLTIQVFLLMGGTLSAQETGSCAEKLKGAQNSFARGQTEVVPSLLNECLSTGGFKREEELAAYKLLIQTYLLNDKLVQADSAMLAFLRSNPEYKTSPTDHSSFVYLYNNFNVKPVLMMSFILGTNLPYLSFIDENPVQGEPVSSKYSSDAANLFFSFDARYKFTERIEAGVGLGYSQMKFSNNVIVYNTIDGLPYQVAGISYKESQQRIEIPFFATYDLKTGTKFTPYLRAGAGISFNLSVTADAVTTFVTGSKQSPRTGETLKRKDSRAPVNVFAQAGAGMKYKIPRGFFFAEVRSNIGITQENNPGGKTVDELQGFYFWSDPGFRLNTLNLNAGITFIFYKPSKKAEAK
jgi:Outer membrane protein beta-barrel domain